MVKRNNFHQLMKILDQEMAVRVHCWSLCGCQSDGQTQTSGNVIEEMEDKLVIDNCEDS